MVRRVIVLAAVLASASVSRPFPAAVASETSALGEPWDSLVGDFDARMKAVVDQRLARLPHPIDVEFHPHRVADFDYGHPVLAAAAVDLDGSAPDELVMLTTAELVVLRGTGRGQPEVAARVSLPADLDPAMPHPRDPVGALAVAHSEGHDELWVFSSSYSQGVRYPARLPLTPVGRFAGLPLCPPRAAPLSPGRSVLVGTTDGLPERFVAARCSPRYFDEKGRPMRAFAVLDTAGTLHVTSSACADDDCHGLGESDSPPPAMLDTRSVGTAFALADIDRDGRVEIVAASARPPGDGERITVYEGRAGSLQPGFGADFAQGAVAVVVGQLDGDPELEVVSLHRRFRHTDVEVWTWN